MNKITLTLILIFSYCLSYSATVSSTPVFPQKTEASFTKVFNCGNYSNSFDSSQESVNAIITL